MRRALPLVILLLLAWGDASGQTFVRHTRRFIVGPNPCSIAARDLNGDGIPEIVTANRGAMTDPGEERPANEELSLLIGKPKLLYIPQAPLRAGFGPYCVALINMDALKSPDILVGSFHTAVEKHLTLARNIGHNELGEIAFDMLSFNVPTDALSYTRKRDQEDRPIYTTPGITSIAAGEFNGDEYRDVVATGWSSDVLIFFPGVKGAYLDRPNFIAARGGPRDVRIADFDKDGKMDLVTAMYASGEIVVWRGDGAGRFTEANRFPSRGRLTQKVRVADMNGDGLLDLVVSHCRMDDSIVVFYAQSPFSFPLSQEIVLGRDREAIEDDIQDIVVEDLNDDGRPDIAVACAQSQRVVVFINPGGGYPIAFREEVYSYEKSGSRPHALCVADFDVNGKPDLAVALWGTDEVALLLGR